MILTPSSLSGLTVGYRKNFNAGLMGSADRWSRIAMEVQSGTRATSHPFLGDAPVMREWLGDRKFHQLASSEFTIKNRDWESGIQLPKKTSASPLANVEQSRASNAESEENLKSSLSAALKVMAVGVA